MWDDGTSVYYLFQLETFLTSLGHFIQPMMIGGVITILTYLTVAIEWSSLFLIFSPIYNVYTLYIVGLIYTINRGK